MASSSGDPVDIEFDGQYYVISLPYAKDLLDRSELELLSLKIQAILQTE
jgi:hypothetical protein